VVLICSPDREELARQWLDRGATSYVVTHPGYLYQLPWEVEDAHSRAELLRSEEALRKSEERLRLAQQAARVGTWEWDVKIRRIDLVRHALGSSRATSQRRSGYPRSFCGVHSP
jgi:PAS domain-containing protein